MRHAHRSLWQSQLCKSLGILAVLAFVGSASASRVGAATWCGWSRDFVVVYFSDASHSHEVGYCVTGPCSPTPCTGQKTQFTAAHPENLCYACF